MARVERLRHLGALAVFFVLISGLASARSARADDLDGGTCPDVDGVWASVIKLVPSAAPQLLAARPHVSILDEGDRYRVRALTDHGELERVYVDPGRECVKRTRFAAEFIVLALLPPVIAEPPTPSPPPATAAASGSGAQDATGSATSSPDATAAPIPPTPPPAPPPREPPPPPKAPPPPPEPVRAPEGPPSPPIVRIEVSALAEASPRILGAPAIIAWGAELRAQMGRGTFTAIASIGYYPEVDFARGGIQIALTRVPITLGVRARSTGRYADFGFDLGAAFDFEEYEGLDLTASSASWRVAPGLEAAVVSSLRVFPRFAPILSVRCAAFPFVQNLEAAPVGNVTKTPAIWLGVGLGASLEL